MNSRFHDIFSLMSHFHLRQIKNTSFHDSPKHIVPPEVNGPGSRRAKPCRFDSAPVQTVQDPQMALNCSGFKTPASFRRRLVIKQNP